jgi:membrane complex biogenesis BtpA family protein
MPGDPRYTSGGFEQVRDTALRDVDALIAGGVQQMIVENFGSAPFRKGTVADPLEPHVHAFMARVVDEARRRGAIVGVNCLRNDGVGALGVAAACGASFVRVNVLSGAYVTDQGVIEGDAARLLRYRRALEADSVAIIADVLVKHATPLAALTLENAIADTVKRGGADAIVVSGAATGAATDLSDLQRAHAVSTVPLLVGSGVTLDSLPAIRPYVDGVIVGTALKRDGDVAAPVDAARVRGIVDAWSAT